MNSLFGTLLIEKRDLAPLTPLFYPGGKTRARKVVGEHIPGDITKLLSPFLGGGSIELMIAAKGIPVVANDAFAPLANFWNEALTDPEGLARRVTERYFPMDKSAFQTLQKGYESEPAEYRAAAYYALNRRSFGGLTFSGGCRRNGVEEEKFSEKSIARLAAFRAPNLQLVQNLDYQEFLSQHPHDFAYMDPPYLIETGIYGRRGNQHKHFNHGRLQECLARRESNWLLSYNDVPEVRAMYRDCEIIPVKYTGGLNKEYMNHDLLIRPAKGKAG